MSDNTKPRIDLQADGDLEDQHASLLDDMQADLMGAASILKRYSDGSNRGDEINELLKQATRAEESLGRISSQLDTRGGDVFTDGKFKPPSSEQDEIDRARSLRVVMMDVITELQQAELNKRQSH